MLANDSWNDRRRIHIVVAEDLRIAASLTDKTEEQFARRTILRTVFTVIDGLCWYLKTEALNLAENQGIRFSHNELKVLTEETETTDKNGKARRQRHFASPIENVRVSMAAFAKVRGCELPVDIRKIPSAYSDCLAIRHRVTHPKSAAALRISDVEFSGLTGLLNWLLAVSDWITEQDVQYIERVRQATSEMIADSIREIRKSVPRSEN